jgi:uncharacterized protein (DUF362 family)
MPAAVAAKIPRTEGTVERPIVAITHCRTYDAEPLAAAIAAAVKPLGGWSRWIRPGAKVLVKPNCIVAAPAERQAQTHPAFVAEICRQLLDLGARPFVGDSPAWGSMTAAARKSGLAPLLDRLGVPLVEFRNPVKIENASGRVCRRLTLDRAVIEADAVVNVPKLKSHGQLYVTLAIKNLFGCVSGKRKAWWHFKAGDHENYFARMLCEVCALVNPAITIMDAVIGMEGDGPIGGTPRPIGAVLASTDAPALERVACEIMGADLSKVRTLAAAAELGIGTTQFERIDVVGDPLEPLRVKDFQFPNLVPIGMSFPRLVRSTLKNAWIVRRDSRAAAR